MGAEIVKVMWEWAPARITALVRACIELGHHPEGWKTAKGVVIPKPGKPDYTKVRAHRVISLLDSIGKLVERTAAHLIADHLERQGKLHDGQYGCRKRRSAVDAVAVLMNRTQQAWQGKRVAGALMMDVKSAFNNVSKPVLNRRLLELGIEPDLVRWTDSFMSDRKVRLVLEGKEGEEYKVETGVPQGSPVAPILFTAYLSGIFDQVEAACPGVQGLSFVDDVAWWADGKTEKEVAEALGRAAMAALDWARENGVTFDQAKTEAMFLSKRRRKPTETVRVGDDEIPFNKQATRWLGVWIDSKMTLKEHHSARMKSARKAMGRIRRLTGQAGLCPGACRKALVACVQATALYGAELWWDDRKGAGVKTRCDDLQKLENQMGRAVTGNFRTTNLGVVMAESGLRPAECLLNNRSRRHVLRLMSLPKGNQAKSLPGCNTAMGQRMAHFSEHSGWVEEIILPEEGPTELDAKITVAEAAWAEQEARKADGQPGLTLWTDGSRDENGGVGYAVVWRKGRRWAGRKVHMGYYQEAYDAECAAIARALAVAARQAKRHKLGRVRIFTDAQAAIARMTHDEPGPGQTYAIQARQAIAILRKQEPAIEIEINWCPAHKGIPGNEVADGWAKLAASEPNEHGVEWLTRADGTRLPERPTSLAHLRRRASEKKWPEARSWCERRNLNQGYVLRKRGKPDPTPTRAEKRTASRFYQLKSGHALTGVYLKSTDNRPDDHCWWCDPDNISGTPQTRDHLFKHCSRWKDQQAQLWARVKKETRKGKQRWRVGDLLADERCSPAVLDFLRTTYVGRAAPPVEESWDSDEEEEERAVAAAGVLGEEEEAAE